MKKRVHKVANFLAFNLLFFALYLNFIQKDKASLINNDRTVQPAAAAFSGTILVTDPDKYLHPSGEVTTETSSEQNSVVKRAIN